MKIFFTADLHLDHDAIRRHCNRPFSTVDEMNQTIIQNWNNVVPKQNSLVYVIGDFAWKRHLHFLMLLNGKKILVTGNHDKANQEVLRNFTEVHKGLHRINIEGQDITLCHYAMVVWASSCHGSWLLYGHSHGRIKEFEDKFAIDVGTDIWGFSPISFEIIKYVMSKRIKKKFQDNGELEKNVQILRERNLKYIEELKKEKEVKNL